MEPLVGITSVEVAIGSSTYNRTFRKMRYAVQKNPKNDKAVVTKVGDAS